jgi:hypothetical protein
MDLTFFFFCLDTKETKSQGFFLFLTPKLQKIAKHKKLALNFSAPYFAFMKPNTV